MTSENIPPTADREELLRLLTREARSGKVTAISTLLRELKADEELPRSSTGSIIDELAARRDGKTCSRCERVKPASEFTKNRQANDGLGSWCKQCHREAARASRQKKRRS